MIGKPLIRTEANANQTTYSYNDPLDRVKTVTLPGGGLIDYVYSVAGSPSMSVRTKRKQDSCGTNDIISTDTFDGMGRLMTSEMTGGAYTERLFDGMGRAYKVSAPTGPGQAVSAWTTTTFDALGRPVRVETSDGAATVSAYNNNEAHIGSPLPYRRW